MWIHSNFKLIFIFQIVLYTYIIDLVYLVWSFGSYQWLHVISYLTTFLTNLYCNVRLLQVFLLWILSGIPRFLLNETGLLPHLKVSKYFHIHVVVPGFSLNESLIGILWYFTSRFKALVKIRDSHCKNRNRSFKASTSCQN